MGDGGGSPTPTPSVSAAVSDQERAAEMGHLPSPIPHQPSPVSEGDSMATVHIPAPMRSLTGGETEVVAPGETLRELIENLEAAYPGIKARLVDGDRIRANLATFVDGIQVTSGLS